MADADGAVTVESGGSLGPRRLTTIHAVGQALGHNPIPIVIPCHRVIAAGGRIGGYGGGLGIKRKLLRLEGALAAVAG